MTEKGLLKGVQYFLSGFHLGVAFSEILVAFQYTLYQSLMDLLRYPPQ